MSDTVQDKIAPDEDGPLQRRIGRNLLLLFIIGDILGAGVYALTGEVAGEVGGALWIPFVIAFVVAALTAGSPMPSSSASTPRPPEQRCTRTRPSTSPFSRSSSPLR